MTVPLPNLVPPLGAATSIPVDVTAQFNITPYVAVQRVNAFLLMDVGNLLRSATPELRVAERLCWLVPVELTSPARGIVGRVGELLVDVETGEVLADASAVQRIATNAEELARRFAP